MRKTNKVTGYSARERIRAFTGEPTEERLAIEGLDEIAREIHERHKRRALERKQFREISRETLALILGGKKIPRIRSRVTPFEQPEFRRPIRKIEPAILLGSIEAVFAPPYDYQWTAGFGGNHGDWNDDHDPASLQQMIAEKASGDLMVRNKVVLEDFNDAYAAVGVFYRPLTSGFKRFRFGAHWDYSWKDESNTLTANNDGWIRIFIFERNLDGSGRTMIANEPALHAWSDGTSAWTDWHSDSGVGLIGGFESMPFMASPDKTYELWAWIGTEVQADDDDFLGGWSLAEAFLQMHVPAMSIKEA